MLLAHQPMLPYPECMICYRPGAIGQITMSRGQDYSAHPITACMGCVEALKRKQAGLMDQYSEFRRIAIHYDERDRGCYDDEYDRSTDTSQTSHKAFDHLICPFCGDHAEHQGPCQI